MYDGYLLWQMCGLLEAQNFHRCQQFFLSVYCSMYMGEGKSIPAISIDVPSAICRACIKATSSAFWLGRHPWREATGPDHLLPVHQCCPRLPLTFSLVYLLSSDPQPCAPGKLRHHFRLCLAQLRLPFCQLPVLSADVGRIHSPSTSAQHRGSSLAQEGTCGSAVTAVSQSDMGEGSETAGWAVRAHAGFRASMAPRQLLGGEDFFSGDGRGRWSSWWGGRGRGRQADKQPVSPAELRTAGKAKVPRLVNKRLWSYIQKLPGRKESEYLVPVSLFLLRDLLLPRLLSVWVLSFFLVKFFFPSGFLFFFASLPFSFFCFLPLSLSLPFLCLSFNTFSVSPNFTRYNLATYLLAVTFFLISDVDCPMKAMAIAACWPSEVG